MLDTPKDKFVLETLLDKPKFILLGELIAVVKDVFEGVSPNDCVLGETLSAPNLNCAGDSLTIGVGVVLFEVVVLVIGPKEICGPNGDFSGVVITETFSVDETGKIGIISFEPLSIILLASFGMSNETCLSCLALFFGDSIDVRALDSLSS